MAFRNFPGASVEWLLARRTKINLEIAEGKTLVEGHAGEGGFEKQIDETLSAERRRDLVSWDLYVIDPIAYPLENQIPVTRTTVVWY